MVFDADSGHSSVFETTHIISSRTLSQYDDFPMPPDYPDYPSHEQLAAYFQSYARHFDLYPHIRFATLVTHCRPAPTGGWEVTTVPDAEPGAVPVHEHFDKLVVANGHHWDPRWPDYPGEFSGALTHSHSFKRAAPFANQRVLVIGGGNSACDVAVETARVSARTDLSWRRGYWIVPKFVFGTPSDVIHNRLANSPLGALLPESARVWALERVLRLVNGPHAAHGLPDPDHRFGETHPTVNSELLYALRHGRIGVRPDIARFDGRDVHFTDGSHATYDAVVACTGYRISHPFFDGDLIDYSEGPVPLYLKMILPTRDDLAFIGLFQPLGCIWPAAELQARILAAWWSDRWSPPADRAAAIQAELDRPHLRQVDSPRHTITVDYPRFRKELLAATRAARSPAGTTPATDGARRPAAPASRS